MSQAANRIQKIGEILAKGVLRSAVPRSPASPSPEPPPADGASQGDPVPSDAGEGVAATDEPGSPGQLGTELYITVRKPTRAGSSKRRAPVRDGDQREHRRARTSPTNNHDTAVLAQSHPNGGGGVGEVRARVEGDDE